MTVPSFESDDLVSYPILETGALVTHEQFIHSKLVLAVVRVATCTPMGFQGPAGVQSCPRQHGSREPSFPRYEVEIGRANVRKRQTLLGFLRPN